MNRSSWICLLAFAALLTLLLGCSRPGIGSQAPTSSDATIIVGATVFDGSGGPPAKVNVRMRGDRIVSVGSDPPGPGDVVIDAGGLALAPGFIDSHSHADSEILDRPQARAALNQGITTVITGADGGSISPLTEFFQTLESQPATINLASFGGHGTYRSQVMGEDFRRPASEEEVERMRQLLRTDLDAGALGLSTGLEYDPGIFATTAEVIELSREAASVGGRYSSHLRSEDRAFWEAIEEILDIGRQAAIPVNITHIKLALQSTQGEADRLLARLDRAREEGIDVTADIYPYTYWQSTLEVLFPGRDFDSLESARFAVTEVSTPEQMRVANFAPAPELAGKSLAEIAELRDTEPAQALMDLIAEAQRYRADTGEEDVESVIAVSMAEPDIERLLRWPWISICTDGELWGSHPRGFASFPRVLAHYVRERRVISLEAAIHKMTDRAAANFGLEDRGRIAAGMYADLVLFDPQTVMDRATLEAPHTDSVGIVKVWVNGQMVWSDGEVTDARPGRVLRRLVS